MNAPAAHDEPSEPGFVSMGAKGAGLAFALTAVLLAALYLLVGGKEKPREEGQADSYRRTMPSLSSYQKRQSTKPGSRSTAPRVEKPLPSPAPKTIHALDPPASALADKPQAEVTPTAQPPRLAKPEIPVAPSPKENKKPETQGKEGRPWVINVASVESKADAQRVVDNLKKNGHNAYIIESDQKGNLWYRVRVGFFQSIEEADLIGQQISRRYGFQSPWTLSVNME
jgi:cell division septation protein DedD